MLHVIITFMCYSFGFLIPLLNSSGVRKIDLAVKVVGGEKVALKVANEANFNYLGLVGNLQDTYHFQMQLPVRTRYKRSLDLHVDRLRSHEAVSWVEEQEPLIRKKRYFKLDVIKKLNCAKRFVERKKVKKRFNDPRWPEEWYIYDMRSFKNDKSDMQVIPVWDMNITGRGVKITILDDGIEHTHPDMVQNYDPFASYDLNDNDDDPMPHLDPGTNNEHGTRCASQIAMSPNNNICGVGIAYDSKIGGIRMLDGIVNDILEAKAIGFRNDYIDIYSASWGPADDGKSMDQPRTLTTQALIRGTQLGRNGKGNIYVWASGNGGYYYDSCACDGYVSSIYVISVSSISKSNTPPPYIEKCSSTMCSTYSSSHDQKSKLIAADVRGSCTDQHTGTSASAPYAAGIFALVLEMNPNLTWRDMKHLVAWTSQYKHLKKVKGWKKNAAGFWVNSRFGFGLLDAYKMVKKAKTWTTVPNMKNCDQEFNNEYILSSNKSVILIINGDVCSNKIRVIEHILVKVNIKYPNRGVLLITLKSPNGMNTTLLPSRQYDNDTNGLINWPLNSVHNWGESPKGNWIIFIEDRGIVRETRAGTVFNITFQFIGMDEVPDHMRKSLNGQRDYD